MRAEVLQRWRHANSRRSKLIFVDEICFTKSSIKLLEYSRSKSPLTADQDKIYTQPSYAIVGVSAERGVEHYEILHEPVDEWSFNDFVEDLVEKHGRKRFTLFFDQLGSHTTDLLLHTYKTKRINYIKNVSYSPIYNAVEAIFSKCK